MDCIIWKYADADAVAHRLGGRFHAVHTEAAKNRDGLLARRICEFPLRFRTFGRKYYAGMGFQVQGFCRFAPSFDVGGRSTGITFHGNERAAYETGIFQVCNPDREIESLFNDIDKPVGKIQLDVDFGNVYGAAAVKRCPRLSAGLFLKSFL